jgi:hypothetical protein
MPGEVLTTETGDGQVVKLHRGVGHDNTEGRALLAGTIAHSATDGVFPECRGIRARRRVDVGFQRGIEGGRRRWLPGTTFNICDRHREDARHLPGAQRRRVESDLPALRRYRANDEYVRASPWSTTAARVTPRRRQTTTCRAWERDRAGAVPLLMPDGRLSTRLILPASFPGTLRVHRTPETAVAARLQVLEHRVRRSDRPLIDRRAEMRVRCLGLVGPTSAESLMAILSECP